MLKLGRDSGGKEDGRSDCDMEIRLPLLMKVKGLCALRINRLNGVSEKWGFHACKRAEFHSHRLTPVYVCELKPGFWPA